MRHQHEERDARSGAENDDGAEHMDIFDKEIERHGFLAAFLSAVAEPAGSSARINARSASRTPVSVSAIQCPSLPDAGNTENWTFPPPSRNASASLRDNSGEK